jgi:hypothetical protein
LGIIMTPDPTLIEQVADYERAADGLDNVSAALNEVHALSREQVDDGAYDAHMMGQIAAVEHGASLLRRVALQGSAALPSEAIYKRIFLAGHSDGWIGNQQRRDVEHVDAEKGWSLYVKNGALDDALIMKLWNLHRRGVSYASDTPAVNLLLADLSEGLRVAAERIRPSPTPETDRQEQGVPASPSGCQPSASAAVASSLSGIPNAGDE